MRTQSRWIAAAVTTAVAALAMGQVSAQTYANSGYGYTSNGYGYGHSRAVRCESIGSRRNFCRVDTRGGVRISRQLSQRSCIQGRNWSYTSQGIWVSGGCRADFAISSGRGYRNGDRYGANGYSSNSYSGNGYGTSYGSGSTYPSSDYGYQNNGYRDGNSESGHTHYVDGSGQVIHCQSTVDGRTYCGDSHTRYTMSGNRDPDCIENQTWGRDGRGTWVSGDCNADFSIDQGYNDDDSGYSGYYRP